MKNLSEKAILVTLKVSHWSGKKDDKKVATDIEIQHNAINAGRYKKNLIDDDTLKQVHSLGAETRNFVKANTLPWGENNVRLLPSIHLLDFLAKFRDYQSRFQDACDTFIMHYPSLIIDAKMRLSTLFDPGDYPSTCDIRGKFSMDVACDAIAKLDDFRLQVDELELEKLKADMERSVTERIAGATKDIWTRIKEKVGHMVDKLSDKEARFHDTLVTNVQELVDLLPKLNITDDPDIDQVVSSMKTLVVDPDNLRDNGRFRSQKAREAQVVLDKINSFMAA